LDAVIHHQEEGLVVVTVRQFLCQNAASRSYGFSCDSSECLEIERDVALGHLVGFVTKEAEPRAVVELISVMNTCPW
jgi:hypothetical protein